MQRKLQITGNIDSITPPDAEFTRTLQGFRCGICLHRGRTEPSSAHVAAAGLENMERNVWFELEAAGPHAEDAIERLQGLILQFAKHAGRHGR